MRITTRAARIRTVGATIVLTRLTWFDTLSGIHEPAVVVFMLADCDIDIVEEVGGSTEASLSGVFLR